MPLRGQALRLNIGGDRIRPARDQHFMRPAAGRLQLDRQACDQNSRVDQRLPNRPNSAISSGKPPAPPAAPIGQRIAIHATRKTDKQTSAFATDLMYGPIGADGFALADRL